MKLLKNICFLNWKSVKNYYFMYKYLQPPPKDIPTLQSNIYVCGTNQQQDKNGPPIHRYTQLLPTYHQCFSY